MSALCCGGAVRGASKVTNDKQRLDSEQQQQRAVFQNTQITPAPLISQEVFRVS